MSGPRLKKQLGQHHLTNPAVLRPLLDFLAPQPGERVVEIGPGGGILTGELLRSRARVWALELDAEWAWPLRRRMRATAGEAAVAGLQAVVADALDFPWSRLPAPTLVAGNLPYNVATPLIAGVLPHHERVPRAAFLLQKEVAERLTAQPGTRAYGALTVLVSCHAEAMILGRVKPGSFRPPPKVDSAFVGLRLRPPPLPPPQLGGLLDVVRLGFAQKRKMLRNALEPLGRARVEAALDAAGLPPTSRAEELSLARWIDLWRALGTPQPSAPGRPLSG